MTRTPPPTSPARSGPDRFYVEPPAALRGDARRNAALRSLAETLGVRTVATGDVHSHHPRRTRLQDVLVASRTHVPRGLRGRAARKRESVLLDLEGAAARFPDDPEAVRASVDLAERLTFDLTQELGYRYPDFSDGPTPADVQLAEVCRRAFEERYRHAPHPLRTRAASACARSWR